MFRLIYNVCTSFSLSIWFILMSIITGKISKVSIYHMGKFGISPFDVCSEKYIKIENSDFVDSYTKEEIIRKFINHLSKDEKFSNVVDGIDFPIFDGVEITGSTNFNDVISKSLNEFIKNDIINGR